jgi:hypothetical protein
MERGVEKASCVGMLRERGWLMGWVSSGWAKVGYVSHPMGCAQHLNYPQRVMRAAGAAVVDVEVAVVAVAVAAG